MGQAAETICTAPEQSMLCSIFLQKRKYFIGFPKGLSSFGDRYIMFLNIMFFSNKHLCILARGNTGMTELILHEDKQ
jgi:hypothetical protein